MEEQKEEIIEVVKKRVKTYPCPFCGGEKLRCNKTEIKYRGRWIKGCQGCFLSEVENPEKFNKQQLKFIPKELL